MSDNTERLRKHVASYRYLSTHRQNCLDVCDELDSLTAKVERLEKVRDTANQFMLEVSAAMQSGPGWYTHGESGLRKQVYMWIDRMKEALAEKDSSS